MSTAKDTAPAITITAGKTIPPVAYYEAVWHEPQADGRARAAKARIGRAWLDYTGDDEHGRPAWRKRRGRVVEGWFDERRAHAAAPDVVAAWRRRQAAKTREPDVAENVTVRALAHEWLDWLRDVKGASPSTVRDYEALLREPGTPAKRGKGRSAGRIMREFGDRPAASVTVRDVAAWLKKLDGENITPRTVNKHRQILANIFKYGRRPDTYALTVDPVTATDKRREPPPGRLDYYEVEEVEALARAAAAGAHRQPRGRAREGHDGPERPARLTGTQLARRVAESALRAEQDAQDGELFRVLLYTGLRIGEARALRWVDVEFLPDMSGAVLDVRHAVSAGEEKPPKSWKPRTVPVPKPAAEALARLSGREHFTSPDDYVFVNRVGGRLDDSAIRRRYTAAREAAGLRDVKLHGLRHAAGSIIAQSAGVVVARDVLGHSKLETTNRYLHGKADARAVAAMNAAFGVMTDIGDERAGTVARRPLVGLHT